MRARDGRGGDAFGPDRAPSAGVQGAASLLSEKFAALRNSPPPRAFSQRTATETAQEAPVNRSERNDCKDVNPKHPEETIMTLQVTDLSAEIIKRAKRAFTTRRVPANHMRTLISGDVRPAIGDLVMARVDETGSHKRIETPSGRRANLVPGDTIIVAYGNRYAPDQFEAVIGDSLAACDLVAAGGVAANKIASHDRMHEPTRITPLGLVGNAMGDRINLSHYGIALSVGEAPQITVVLVVGTSMNAGKTYTAATLVRAFADAGLRVAGIKSTGTGAGGDLWTMADHGADLTLDFTDAGLPSTYLVPPAVIETSVLGLINHAAEQGCDIAVVEIADGLQHEETATLLKSSRLKHVARGVVFAANDALGAAAGLASLRQWGHDVIAISGQLCRSPLAMREAQAACDIDVISPQDIMAGALTRNVLSKPRAVTVARSNVTRIQRPKLAERLAAWDAAGVTDGELINVAGHRHAVHGA